MGHTYSRVGSPTEQNAVRAAVPKKSRDFDQSAQHETALSEGVFHSMLTLERRRAERSRRPFVLMLLDANLENGAAAGVLNQAVEVVLDIKRETDLVGWYKEGAIFGVIFTEVTFVPESAIVDTLRTKFERALITHLGAYKAGKLSISLHVFPENWKMDQLGSVVDSKLYPDLKKISSRKRIPLIIKRAIDIIASAGLLLVLSPMLAIIAAIIKLTSNGPVIFEQERLGQFGARFKCMKFRTMYANNDPKIHQEFVQQFIAGIDGLNNSERPEKPIYKLTKDPRVTSIGRF